MKPGKHMESSMAKIKTFAGTKDHKVVSHAKWIAARKALLVKEKKFSRLRDELGRQRRALPWEKVETNYVFDGPDGKETLAQGLARKATRPVRKSPAKQRWSPRSATKTVSVSAG